MKPEEVAALLEQEDRILLLTHRNPDGDTMGSAAALCSALRRKGKTAYLFPNVQVTEKLWQRKRCMPRALSECRPSA